MTTRDDRHQVRTTQDETRYLDDLQTRHNLRSRSEAIRYCIQKVAELEGQTDAEQPPLNVAVNSGFQDTIAITEMYGTASFVAITELFSLLLQLLDEDNSSDVTRPDNMRRELYQTIFNEAPEVEATFNKMRQKIEAIKARGQSKRSASRNLLPSD